ncbi:hypothetical protein QUB10_27545 [Microcoleus sp. B5-D4]|uniref:ISAzo13-like element transposase-related protein n=1 Tax=unclassified Microcoleus TaxID=2642155 RepID=UPI002FD1B262
MVNLSQNILTTDEQCSIRCVPPALPSYYQSLSRSDFYKCRFSQNYQEKTHTNQGLSVVVNVVDKIYKIGRKVTEDFQKNLKIVFDEYLSKWNYRAVPQLTH